MTVTAEIAYQTAWTLDGDRAARRAAERGEAASRRTAATLAVLACGVWLLDLALVVTG